MTTTIRRTCEQLSLPLVAAVTAVFTTGVVSGWLAYQGRSPHRQNYVQGTAAWWQHAVLALIACLVFGYARWRRQRERGRHSGRLWLLAPVGKPAAARLAGTSRAAGGAGGAGRILLAAWPAAAILYCFWRAGLQVLGGLDPNMTVSAWGGPSYLGAMACHYLDCFLLVAAAAWLLDRILLPDFATYRPSGTRNGHMPAVDPTATPR